MKESNYDKMKRQMQPEFLKYDQNKMIEKFNLDHDQDSLYVNFFSRRYRIDRHTGVITWFDGDTEVEAGYNDAMTIYDLLCSSKENCTVSGEFVRLNGVKGVVAGAGSPEEGMFPHELKLFDENVDALADACKKMGGQEYHVGDVAYKLPMFDFMDIIFQFWCSDEDFPAGMKIMWDKNITDFMHFETAAFAMCYFVYRLRDEIK